MDIQKQVCNLELAKRLKELGVNQDSTFKWRLAGNTGWQVERHFGVMMERQYSAFTVAELGEMLPDGIFTDKGNVTKEWMACVARFSEFNRKKDNENVDVFFVEETEADARAKMLIYLLENKLINL